MVNKIIELENDKKYVILDEKNLDNINYYFGLRLNSNKEPTNSYLFFQEVINGKDTYLIPVENEDMKGVLLTSFTINYLDKVYDEV